MKKILSFVLFPLLVIGLVAGGIFSSPNMAFATGIALDTSAVGTGKACNPTNTLASYTITGTDTALVVVVANLNTTASSVTWGTTSLTLATTTVLSSMHISIWYAATGSGGTNTITATMSGSFQSCNLAAISLKGVDQTTPLDVKNTPPSICSGAGCANPSQNTTTTKDGDWLIDILSQQSGPQVMTPTASGQTAFVDNVGIKPSTAPNWEATYRGPISPAGTAAMSYTMTSSNWLHLTAAFMPVQGGGGGTTNTCYYAGSGDWDIKYSDNCYATTTTYVQTGKQIRIIRDAAGSFAVAPGVTLNSAAGGTFMSGPLNVSFLATSNGVTFTK